MTRIDARLEVEGEGTTEYHFESDEGVSDEQLRRLVRGVRESETIRTAVMAIPVRETRSVRLGDDRYYHIYRESEWTFELRDK